MKTFKQWAEDNGLDLPVVTDAEPTKKASSENRIRTGLTSNYPAAYSRGQYPDLAQTPYKGTAVLDLQQKPNSNYQGPKAAK